MEVRSVETIVRALNDAGVQYLVVGGLAVIAHGYERFTDDVDLVISLEPANITAGLCALAAAGYRPSIPVTPEMFADRELRESWRRDKGMLVLKLWSDEHRRTPLDVFVYEPFDFPAQYATAKWHEIAVGVCVPVVPWDALMAMKREAGRPQDMADIATLEEVQKLREARPDDQG